MSNDIGTSCDFYDIRHMRANVLDQDCYAERDPLAILT